MSFENLFPITLVVATFLSSLVAGLLFIFAIVVMPGIKRLSDGEFIRAFQAMDGIIQNNHPLFVLVWVGSVFAVIAAAVMGLGQTDGPARVLMLAAAVAYLVGVQLPTAVVNVPLNNQLQKLKVEGMDAAAQRSARSAFEPRWNRYNDLRTIVAGLTAAGMMILLAIL